MKKEVSNVFYDKDAINTKACEWCLCDDEQKKEQLCFELCIACEPLIAYLKLILSTKNNRNTIDISLNDALDRAIRYYRIKWICADKSDELLKQQLATEQLSKNEQLFLYKNKKAYPEFMFCSWLYELAKNSVYNHILYENRPFYMPVYNIKTLIAGKRFMRDYENKYGKPPSVGQIAEELKIDKNICIALFMNLPANASVAYNNDGEEMIDPMLKLGYDPTNDWVEKASRAEDYETYKNYVNSINNHSNARATEMETGFDLEKTFLLLKAKNALLSKESFKAIGNHFASVDDVFKLMSIEIFKFIKTNKMTFPIVGEDYLKLENFAKQNTVSDEALNKLGLFISEKTKKLSAKLPIDEKRIIAGRNGAIFGLCFLFLKPDNLTASENNSVSLGRITRVQIANIFGLSRERVGSLYKSLAILIAQKNGLFGDRLNQLVEERKAKKTKSKCK